MLGNSMESRHNTVSADGGYGTGSPLSSVVAPLHDYNDDECDLLVGDEAVDVVEGSTPLHPLSSSVGVDPLLRGAGFTPRAVHAGV